MKEDLYVFSYYGQTVEMLSYGKQDWILVNGLRIKMRELEVLGLISQGKSHSEAGQQLRISTGSVKNALYEARKRNEISTTGKLVSMLGTLELLYEWVILGIKLKFDE